MKRKWKWLILLCIPVLCFAVWLWAADGRKIPVEVIGDIPQEEIDEIIAALKREMRREIFPNMSWQSVRGIPSAVKGYSSLKLLTIEVIDDSQYKFRVFAWSDTNGLPRFRSITNYFVNDTVTEDGKKFAQLSSEKGRMFFVSREADRVVVVEESRLNSFRFFRVPGVRWKL